MAPAVAAKGFPVMAIQWRPCNGGFCVRTGRLLKDWANPEKVKATKKITLYFFIGRGYDQR
jgi:hypothetical protein